jgi:hypothetical protein
MQRDNEERTLNWRDYNGMAEWKQSTSSIFYSVSAGLNLEISPLSLGPLNCFR